MLGSHLIPGDVEVRQNPGPAYQPCEPVGVVGWGGVAQLLLVLVSASAFLSLGAGPSSSTHSLNFH